MAQKLPQVKKGAFAALVTDSNLSLNEDQVQWIRETSPSAVVYYDVNSLSIVKDATFSVIVLASLLDVNSVDFGVVLKALEAGGVLQIMGQPLQGQEKLLETLLLNGFVDSNAVVEGERLHITTKKPGYKAEAVKLNLHSNTSNNSVVADKNKIWKLNANDFNEDAYELEDEEALLNDDVEVKKTQDAADCGPAQEGQKKRACKNCVCGLKEMQEAEEKGLAGENQTITPDASACGNCSKGDAFRCASCPYLGTPSFDSGTKPTIKVKEDGSKVLLDVDNEAL